MHFHAPIYWAKGRKHLLLGLLALSLLTCNRAAGLVEPDDPESFLVEGGRPIGSVEDLGAALQELEKRVNTGGNSGPGGSGGGSGSGDGGSGSGNGGSGGSSSGGGNLSPEKEKELKEEVEIITYKLRCLENTVETTAGTVYELNKKLQDGTEGVKGALKDQEAKLKKHCDEETAALSAEIGCIVQKAGCRLPSDIYNIVKNMQEQLRKIKQRKENAKAIPPPSGSSGIFNDVAGWLGSLFVRARTSP